MQTFTSLLGFTESRWRSSSKSISKAANAVTKAVNSYMEQVSKKRCKEYLKIHQIVFLSSF
jgi:hypothetical protein